MPDRDKKALIKDTHMDLNFKEIRQFIRFLSTTDIDEVEITEEGRTLRISRALTRESSNSGAMVSSPRSAQEPLPSLSFPSVAQSRSVEPVMVSKDTMLAITAPMVGTFYKATSPESAPFVRQGDMVKKGQVVCIIEAMKLMNEIESEVSGRVVSIVKENASPVEYGEEMFLVEPC